MSVDGRSRRAPFASKHPDRKLCRTEEVMSKAQPNFLPICLALCAFGRGLVPCTGLKGVPSRLTLITIPSFTLCPVFFLSLLTLNFIHFTAQHDSSSDAAIAIRVLPCQILCLHSTQPALSFFPPQLLKNKTHREQHNPQRLKPICQRQLSAAPAAFLDLLPKSSARTSAAPKQRIRIRESTRRELTQPSAHHEAHI